MRLGFDRADCCTFPVKRKNCRLARHSPRDYNRL